MKPKKKFLKAERLKSRKAIERLFSGKSPSFAQYPIRLVFRESEDKGEVPVQVTISVPKRKFPKAKRTATTEPARNMHSNQGVHI